jgi:hypothetical protein
VARIYAGILGLLAFLTVLARSVVHGSPADPALLRAWLSLVVFAAMGYVIGLIAEHATDELVASHIREQFQRPTAEKPPPSPSAESGA